MSKMLTVRTQEALFEELKRRADAQGVTLSSLVRKLLQEALAERPLATRAGHLKGSLELSAEDDDPWRRQLRERNWRS